MGNAHPTQENNALRIYAIVHLGPVNHDAHSDFWQIQLITDDDIHLIYEVWLNDSGKESPQLDESESPESALALILSLLPKLKAQQLARILHSIADQLQSE